MPSHTPPLLLLIDGSSYLFRAFYALPALANSEKFPTGAIYGVINMLKKLLTEYTPDYIAVVFDTPEKTFRDELYPAYKANRKAIPEELSRQIEPLLEIIKALGLPLVALPGVEADDVIGTLTKLAAQRGFTTVVSTGDKDMAQLVGDKVTLVNTMSGEVLDNKGVLKKFGVPPQRIIDYLILTGDSVDNIPGVPGVGPKTAAKWLQNCDSLSGVIQQATKMTGKVGESLRASIPQFELTKKLVTIDTDISLTKHFEVVSPTDLFERNLRKNPPKMEELVSLFKKLDFKTWLRELGEAKEHTSTGPHLKNYKIILSWDDFDDWRQQLEKNILFAFDTETTSLNTIDAELVGLSFSFKPGEAVYIPLAHDYPHAPRQLPREVVLEKLKPLLENKAYAKIGHNLKYDMQILSNYQIMVKGRLYDSMLESYVLNSTASRHDMDTLSLKHLDHKTTSFAEVASTGKRGALLSFNQIPIKEAGDYSAEDADVAFRLHQNFWGKLSELPRLHTVFTDIEMPLVPVLARMERMGVLIDAGELQKQSKMLAKEIETLEEKAYRLVGHVFNLGSPKQLQEILFKKLKLPVLGKTPGGQPSTSEEVLGELADQYELPKVILEYRSLSKLKSTYTDSLPLQVNLKTGRVHTSYHQAVTATGRLSSSDPNLQNIPARTEQGRRIRQAFIAPSGYKIVSADYSQVELRIMAHLSGDRGLKRAFEQGLDIHKATAAEVLGIPLSAVTPEQRRHAKAINFGLIYGMSAFGLAKQLNVPQEAAQDYMNLYFARYPDVKKYMDKTRNLAKSNGYVETVFGRRLYLPDIQSRNLQRQRAAERAAVNAPMQGTAADVIKRAMVSVDAWLEHSKLPADMTMQVHDELVLEVSISCLEKVVSHLKKYMMEAAELSVPLVVEVGIGDNWDEAH